MNAHIRRTYTPASDIVVDQIATPGGGFTFCAYRLGNKADGPFGFGDDDHDAICNLEEAEDELSREHEAAWDDMPAVNFGRVYS